MRKFCDKWEYGSIIVVSCKIKLIVNIN